MLEQLQAFFQSLTQNRDQKPSFAPDDIRIAVAGLCLQVMDADGVIHAAEREKLRSILREQYQLDEPSLDALLEEGARAESEAVDYYRFTSDLKRALNDEQRQQLIGILWDIVYADGTRSEMEDHAIWRVAELLGVSGRDRVHARQGAKSRSGLTGNDDA
ncbi:tellurite resistance TerB family protein [Rhizobium sp. CAU 1783]